MDNEIRTTIFSIHPLSRLAMRHESVSPCGSYIAQWNSDNDEILEIIETNAFKTYASYNLSIAIAKAMARTLISNEHNARLDVTQVEWEHTNRSRVTKVGVVVRNLSLMVICELGEQREPIVVPQSHVEGISRFQWIPPIDTGKGLEKEELHERSENEAYVNCIQFGVFTRNNLQLKIYSLEKTRVVFTVLKPVEDRILVRPQGKRKTVHWSILATAPTGTNKYMLYHFVNEGAISTLFHTVELDVAAWSPRFDISWSPLGNYFGCFNQSLAGFDVSLYNSLGAFSTTQRATGEPILKVSRSFYNEIDLKVRPITPNSSASWLRTTASEYAIVAGLSLDSQLVINCFCINSFRIEQTVTLDLYHTPNIPLWRKFHGSEYRKVVVAKFPSLFRLAAVTKIQVVDNQLFVVQFESHIFLYLISVDHLRLSFELKGLFMFGGPIKQVISTESGNILISTRDCVYEYCSSQDTLRLVYENMLLHAIQYCKGSVYLTTSLEWDKVSLADGQKPLPTEQSVQRFNVSATEEITDTFALQRLKKRKM